MENQKGSEIVHKKDANKLPDFIRDDDRIGPSGNSDDPRDSLWLGFDGKLNIDQLMSIDRDPNDALRQILAGIVQTHSADKTAPAIEKQLDAAMAAALCEPGKRGVKSGWAKVERIPVLHRAAALFYRGRLEGDDPDWKSCIWEVNRPGFAGGSNFQIGWSHDEHDIKQDNKQILAGSPRPRGADGTGARGRAFLALDGRFIDCRQDRLLSAFSA